MPVEVLFRHQLDIRDAEQYFNDCCVGGDLVLERILPSLRADYGDLKPCQEDWGWFVWFAKEKIRLAIEVSAVDLATDEFRIHLLSKTPRFLFGDEVNDTPELEKLYALVKAELEKWGVDSLRVLRLDDKFRPLAR